MKNRYILFIGVILAVCACKGRPSGGEHVKMDKVYFNHFILPDTVFWIGNDGDQYARIDKGTYYFEALDSTARFNAPPFEIDSMEQFSIELAITGPHDEDSTFYGLIYGNPASELGFVEIKINNAGEYKIRTYELLDEGKYADQIDIKLKKIKVVKEDMDTHFFINDEEVFKYPIQSIKKI